MQFKKTLKTIAVLLSIPTWASAQSTTLLTAYQDAVNNDPIYLAQKAALDVAKTATPEARADLLPQLSLNGQLSHTYQNSKLLGNDDYNSNQYGLNFSQAIFNYSALNNLRRAKTSVQAAATLFSAQEQDLIVRLVRAYLTVLQSRDLWRYTQLQEAFAKDFLSMTERRYHLKFATITEMDQARQQYQLFHSQVISAKINYQQSKQNLSNITATTYAHFAQFKKSFPLLKPNPAQVSDWVSLAKKQNLSLRAAQLDMQTSKQAIDTKRSDFLPSVSATGSYSDNNQLSTQSSGGVPETIRASEVGVSASWNLVQGGLTMAQVDKAASEYTKSYAVMQQRYLEAITNTQNAYIGISEGTLRVKTSALAMQEGFSGLKHTRAGFKAGVQSIFDLLQAQNRLFEAQKQYVRDFYQYIMDTVLLKQAAGVLSPKDVYQLNHYLDVKKINPSHGEKQSL